MNYQFIRVCIRFSNDNPIRIDDDTASDQGRAIIRNVSGQLSQRQRKKPEMLFAHLKVPLKLRRLRLRGLSGAKDEFLMAATVQNLRRLAMWQEHAYNLS